jgi:5-methylcytosine-specific restriction endonuclease McrA
MNLANLRENTEKFRKAYCFPHNNRYNSLPQIRNAETLELQWNNFISNYENINKKEIKRYLCSISSTRSDYRRRYLTTPWWHWLTQKRLAMDGYKCTKCGATEHLEIHHLTYAHKGEEILYMETITTLCESCHDIEHGKKRKRRKQNIPLNTIIVTTTEETQEDNSNLLKYFYEKNKKILNQETRIESNEKQYVITIKTKTPSIEELQMAIFGNITIMLNSLNQTINN